MQKLPLTIEVVRSNLRTLSSLATESALDIVTTLATRYEHVVLTNIDTVADLQALTARKPDLVFGGIYYVIDDSTGAKVWLADELKKHGIAHTGSGKQANRLSINKHLAKQRMIESGVTTAAFLLARKNDTAVITEGALHFPLFVKPTNKSGGRGVDEFSIVHTREQLQSKVASIHTKYASDALIEEYLTGREFSVGVIGGSDGFTAMPLELITAKNENGERYRSMSIRAADNESLIFVENAIEREAVGAFAIEAFRAIGGQGYGRIDIRLNGRGVPYFIEANHIPSLVRRNSSFLMAYHNTTGGNYEDMILHITRLALEHEDAISTLTI